MKYNFDKVTDRTNTYCTQWDYTVDRFGEEGILPFSISDTDFALPEDFVNHLNTTLSNGIYGYTRWRHDDFTNSVVGWYQKRFSYEVENKWIVYSPTVIYSLAELIRLTSEINEKIMLFTPAYDAFFNVVKENDRELVTSDLVIENTTYVINKLDFEEKIKDCKVLVMCSPHNPVGKVWNLEELEYVINICKENNVFLISDEIHMDITFKKKHIPILKVSEYDNMAIITSATKTFNFPSLMFSYNIIRNDIIREKFEVKLKQANGLSSCTIPGLYATMYVYNHLDTYLDEMNDYIYENYLYVKEYIKTNDLKLEINDFEATYLLWIDASHYSEKMSELADAMYHQEKVGVMLGDVYGCKNYLRINIGCPRSKLQDGMDRLNRAIRSI